MTHDTPANVDFKDNGDPTYNFCTAQRRLIQYNLLKRFWFTTVVVVVIDDVVIVVVVVVDDGYDELTLSPGSNSDMVTRSSYVSPPSCLFGPILN